MPTPERASFTLAVLVLAITAALAQTSPPSSSLPAAPAAPAPPGGTVPQPQPTRGQLLYATHCIACHNSQMHWRDARVVRDWPGLVTQVRLWQERGKLQWNDADIIEVARHLNDTIYRLPRPLPPRA